MDALPASRAWASTAIETSEPVAKMVPRRSPCAGRMM